MAADILSMPAPERAIYARVRQLTQATGRPVQADDPVLYVGLPYPSIRSREAVLRLVREGFILAGDGYLKLSTDGGW